MKALPPIKKLCRNPRATFHEISICRAYLEVRQHLTAMNLSYEDNYTLVTINNKSEYKCTLVSPEHNTLTFLPKCVFPPKSKDKKVTKENTNKKISTTVSNNQVDKHDFITVRRLSYLKGECDPSSGDIQNVNTVPVKNDLPTDPSTIKVESSENNLPPQSDTKPRNIKLDTIPAVIDITDSELIDGELQQNENATESNNIKGSIPAVGVSENEIFKKEKENYSPSHIKVEHFSLQEQSNNNTSFNVEWDDNDDLKLENNNDEVCETILIDDADVIIIDDDDDDNKLFSASNLHKLDLDVKDALFKGMHREGNCITAVKHEIKSEVNSCTTPTATDVQEVQDKINPTRKRKLE